MILYSDWSFPWKLNCRNYNMTHIVLVPDVEFPFLQLTVVEGNCSAEYLISFLLNNCVSIAMRE